MKYVPLAFVALVVVALGSWTTSQTNAQLNSTLTPSSFLPLIIKAPSNVQTPEQYQRAQEVINLVNTERTTAGCAPLASNDQLTVAAQSHSEDMALNNFFSHTSPNPSQATLDMRIASVGYNASLNAENIAAGNSTSTSVMNGWMSSGGHRDNILNCNYTDIGVGYYYEANDSRGYRHYWTQVFARP
jgi:uncharacterized protein YkwD